MRFLYIVEVEVSREHGKFAPRDELEEKFRELLDEANPQDYDADNEGHYNVDTWDVRAEPIPKVKRTRRPKRPKTPGVVQPSGPIVHGIPAELGDVELPPPGELRL